MKHTEEWNRKIGLGNKGKVISQQQRDQTSATLTGRPSPLKGTKKSAEFCENVSKGRLANPVDPWNKGMKMDAEYGQRQSEIMLKNWQDPEYRNKQLDILTANRECMTEESRRMAIVNTELTDELRATRSKTMTDIWARPGFREKRSKEASEQMNRLWADPVWAAATIQSVLKASHIKPNKKEVRLEKLLDRLLPADYKYVGHGEMVIGGKCPDFININGQKKIIELFGDYWHKGQDPQDRINIFKKYGYDTLVIWEHELEDESAVSKKILCFEKRKLHRLASFELASETDKE